jgi:agmatine deiminase
MEKTLPNSNGQHISGGSCILQGGNIFTDGNGHGYVCDIVDETTQTELRLRYGLDDIRILKPLPLPDETKHIDMFVYIASPDTVIISKFTPEISGGVLNPNFAVSEAAVQQFQSWGFTNIIRIETPDNGYGVNGPLIYSYTNALVVNDIVLIPSYNGFTQYNENAKSRFETAFPGKTIIQIDCTHSIQWGGGVHCLTLTRPMVVP